MHWVFAAFIWSILNLALERILQTKILEVIEGMVRTSHLSSSPHSPLYEFTALTLKPIRLE